MRIDPTRLSARDAYFTLTDCLIPRPIAWILTCDASDRRNLAPFSFFGGVTTQPMTVMVSVGRRSGGARKDTAANLIATGEGVVHIPHRGLGEAMVASSKDDGPQADEVEASGLEAVPSDLVRPPRLAAAAVAMEAKVVHHQEVGAGPVDMFLLEVIRLHVDDAILSEGRVDPTRLDAVGRLSGSGYCSTTEVFEL